MTKHIWTLVCRESKIDDSNNVSIIDAYETLQFDLGTPSPDYDKTKPFVGPFNFEIISLFYRDKKGTHEVLDVLVKMIDPKGNTLGEFPARPEFKEEHNRVRNRMKFDTIALTTTGTYIAQIHQQKGEKREQVAAVPLDIVVRLNGKEL